jgi:hypothetical protein
MAPYKVDQLEKTNEKILRYCPFKRFLKTKKFLFTPDKTIVCIGKFFIETSDCIGQYQTCYDTDTEFMIL